MAPSETKSHLMKNEEANMNTYIITQRRKNMNNMNNKKTMFSVENCDDGSGLEIKAHGNQAAVEMMVAIGLAQYFGQDDPLLSIDDFITVLKKACEDSEFLDLMVQVLSLYADNKSDGLKAFAMLTAVTSVKSTSEGKMN